MSPVSKFSVVLISPGGYSHVQAFREVAETIYYGLESEGYDVVWSDTVLVSERTPIVFGANLLEDAATLPKHAIVFNLEQVDSGSTWMREPYVSILRTHTVWDYSAVNVDALRKIGVENIHHLPIGHVPQLERIEMAPSKDIDILFYGSQNPRRQAILEKLRQHGLNVVSVFDVYGEQRDDLIARAKIVLNIHFYEAKLFEVVRVSYLLSNGVCVVSESGPDPAEKEFATGVAFAPYLELVDTCLDLLANPNQREQFGRSARNLMRARSQGNFLKQLIVANPPPQPPLIVAPTIINMGSGKDWKPDCLNIDISRDWNPDLIFDLNQPLPPDGLSFETERFGAVLLAEESFDAIICNDVLEHVANLMTAMSTCLRLLKVGGALRINVPYDLSYGAWQDPTHVRAFNERSWLYYTDWFWYMNWDTCRFEVKTLQFVLSPLGHSMHQRKLDQDTILRTPRAVDSMKVELIKRNLTEAEKAEYASRHRR